MELMQNQIRGREILKQMVDFVAEGTVESMDMWFILSALRGPDEHENKLLKESTTARIRYAMGFEPNRYFDVSRGPVDPMTVNHIQHSHFGNHFTNAFYGLKHFGYIDSQGKRL